jgi:membrane protein
MDDDGAVDGSRHDETSGEGPERSPYSGVVTDHAAAHGRDATKPTALPAEGWKDVLVRTKAEAKADRAPMLAAAVAFYSLLALVPALIAIVSLYGLIADPGDVDRQVKNWLGAAPTEVRDLLASQLRSITTNAGAGAGIAVVLGILAALWSASSGMAHLVEATNIAYDEDETRGFVKLRGLAVALTVGAIIFLLFAVTLITVLPSLLAHAGLATPGRIIVGILRWLLLPAGMIVALTVLYRYAPDRDEPKWSWASPGAVVATVAWLIASALFAVYTGNFGKYNQTYGSLGAVVVLMLWLFITALCVIVGAELNAELERQTFRDTTAGEEQGLGRRDAEAADTVGPDADQVRRSTDKADDNIAENSSTSSRR